MINQVIAAILVIQYHQNRMPIPDKMTLLMKIYWFFSISTTMYAILISMIYWGVLFKQDNNVIDLNNILIHGTNSLLLVIDIFIVKHRSNVSQFIWPLFCGIAYLILLTWFYTVVLGGFNRRGQNYIYPILNWNDKPLQAFYAAIGVTVSGAIIHTIIVFLQNVRVFIHKKLYHQKYKFVSNSNSSTRNDLAQIEAQYDKGEAPFILTY
ncbi:hypothetical protein PVAND_007645 [Polypedilum vanderplanki]|uniref:Uncharacterized protein n=1 Tax=Polypedilum vanderplanki TaxID=319348 RepID=A0A9J6C801_POLVA|nr:hypothetical protein PVAND_007645 [Polypedilum vanderplanki]